MPIGKTFLCFVIYHLFPLPISSDGDDHVESVEQCLERNSFHHVEVAANGIDDNPEEPLLDVFASQRPQTHKAQRIGEAVLQGHRGIGKGHQYIIGGSPLASSLLTKVQSYNKFAT